MQLDGFKFIKKLDLKGIQGKEIRIWGEGKTPEFVLKTV